MAPSPDDERPASMPRAGGHAPTNEHMVSRPAEDTSEARLRLLYEVIAQPRASFEQLMQEALERTTRLLGLRMGVLSHIEGDTYTVQAVYAPGTALSIGQTFALSDTPCSITVALDGPLAISHLAESDYRDHPCHALFGIEAYIAATVRVQGRVYGTLNFSGPDPKPFSESDRALISLLARWTGAALERKHVQDQIEQSERILTGVLLSSLDGIMALEAVRSADGDIIDFVYLVANPTATTTYGVAAEEVVGAGLLDVLPGMRTSRVFDDFVHVTETGAPHRSEVFYDADGHESWFDYAVVRLGDGVAATFRDVTERKEAEQALRESEARFAKAFHAAPIAIGIVTLYEGRFVDVNECFCDLTGYTHDELVGHTNEELNLTPTFEDLQASVRRIQAEGALRDIEFQIRSKSGTMRDVTVSAELIEIDGTPCLLGIGFDATERRRLEREVIEAAEFERRRIGQDLHDELGQELTGAAFLGQVLTQKLAARNLPEAEDANQLTALINEALAETRDFSRLLSPVDVQAEGLADALHELTEQTERVFDIPCPFLTEGDVRVSDNVVATHLFRIAQEALNNAVKHAEPSTITVRLTRERDGIRLQVEDDGIGINLPSAQQADSLGLRAMQYRATLIEASLRIAPSTHGTVVRVFLPLDGTGQATA